MSRELFRGCAPAVVCPMLLDGSVDYESFDRLIEHLINEGVSALVINGTTGEASTLSREEKIELVTRAVAISNKRVPIIAGAGSNATASAIQNALDAKNAGADGLLLVTPYYNKTSQRGLIAHFEAIVEAAKLPSILYTVPGRTGMNIAPETVEILAKNPYIVGIKDATGNTSYTVEVLRRTKDLDFSVYSGEDKLTAAICAIGGKGVISVAGNIYPKAFEEMAQAAMKGDLDKANNITNDMEEFITLMFKDVNPIPVKVSIAHLEYGENMLRLPLVPTTKVLEDQIIAEMETLAKKGY